MFDVSAEAYQRFMGRFSRRLAPAFADVGLADVDPLGAVLDVGCGPGVLSAELSRRVGAAAVSAVDPAPAFVTATAAALPEADVRVASAEALPFDGDVFDATLAQLVVHFMADPVAGVGEMARVTRPGGRVSACVWDHGGGDGPLSWFWEVVRSLDPSVPGEDRLSGSSAGQLAVVLASAGLLDVVESSLRVSVGFESFEDWWEPFTFGVGPAGSYVRGLADSERTALRDELRHRRGEGAFRLDVAAWCATGTVS